MSRSSLWVMNNKYEGEEVVEFGNSWLFTPIICDVLFEKYSLEKTFHSSLGKMSFIFSNMFEKTTHSDLNEKINNCKCISDRICWELSNQQVFFTKDKHLIVNSIKEFLNTNSGFNRTNEGLYPLKQEHIIERFNEIADEIMKVDENKFPYFIFKNTSCDDNVEYWFTQYNKENEEYSNIPLSDQEKRCTEFVFIKDNEINKFISNLEYFNK